LLTNIITTVAGTRFAYFNGDNILALNANIGPSGMCCDTVGNIYFSDDYNHRIRKITISTNIITTIAGNGIDGYYGDNIKATDAQISSNYISLTIDTNGHVFFSDSNNNRIRKIDFLTRFFFFFFFFLNY
jgi:streptogramin lyase